LFSAARRQQKIKKKSWDAQASTNDKEGYRACHFK
jgi:hypothetical protein